MPGKNQHMAQQEPYWLREPRQTASFPVLEEFRITGHSASLHKYDFRALGKISIIDLEGMFTGSKWLAVKDKYETQAKVIRNCKEKVS